ncbi:hypothetical protein ACFE35_25260 [Phormidesmis priestleyi ANT.L61.2]
MSPYRGDGGVSIEAVLESVVVLQLCFALNAGCFWHSRLSRSLTSAAM